MSIIHGAASGRFDDEHEPSRSNLEQNRRSWWRRTYGLEHDEYERMVEAQAGRCAVCQRPTFLVVDHDHEDGHVRGLLCRGCNVAIGFIRDDPEVADLMAMYLRRDRESHA